MNQDSGPDVERRERFVAIAPLLICLIALPALVLSLTGAELAAQIVTAALLFVGALALTWYSHNRWGQFDRPEKALSVSLGGLLLYGGFMVPILTAIDSSSPFRLPLMLLGFALVTATAALLIHRTLRDARGSS